MKSSIATAFIFFAFSLQGFSQTCEDQLIVTKNTQLQKIYFKDTSSCLVSVATANFPMDGVDRSYVFSNKGTFMVFNSFGNGPTSSDTGARVFYLFPRLSTTLEITILADGNPQIETPSGTKFVFDAETVRLKSISEGTFTEDFLITKSNKGGLEITHYNHLYLDFGFLLGNDPVTKPNRRAHFVNNNGNTCRVQNDEVIEYRPGDNEWHYPLRFDTDEKLSQFISSRCPLL